MCEHLLFRFTCKGGGKRGHIVADTLLLMMFLGWANERDTKHLFCVHAAQTGKHLLRTQNVSDKNQKLFCVSDTNFVSATNVARTGKRGNICVRNNVSSFATTLKHLKRFGLKYVVKETKVSSLLVVLNCGVVNEFTCGLQRKEDNKESRFLVFSIPWINR